PSWLRLFFLPLSLSLPWARRRPPHDVPARPAPAPRRRPRRRPPGAGRARGARARPPGPPPAPPRRGAALPGRRQQAEPEGFLLAYIGVQVLYLGFYLAAAQGSTLNYVPLLADSVMLTLHCGVALVKVSQGGVESWLYRWSLAFALLADAVLFAIADPVVEVEVEAHLGTGRFFEQFGGLPAMKSTSLPHPYKSNIVFQFHCLYMSLMVMPFRWAAKVMPACMIVYSTVVVICFRSRYDSYEAKGINPTQDTEDMYIETVLMWGTMLLGLFAKRTLEQAQRPLCLALESGKDEIIREKVKRCTAEYEASGLMDKMNSEAPRAADACSVVGRSPRVPASIHSAPAGVQKRLSRKRRGGDQDICDSGDCLPSSASVWIENEALPQRLSTVRPGQRVLCYDNLQRGMKYTDVLDVSLAPGSECTDWMTVVLKDGTKLEMTPNHPVECFSTSDHGRTPGRYIPASEVQAEADSIMVLKTVLVPVSSVHHTTLDTAAGTCTSSAREWVNLSIQHPDRHTVFVSRSCEAAQGAMAVGTLDFPHGGHRAFVKRSFVVVEEVAGTSSEQISIRRTVSAPDLELAQDQDLEAGFLDAPPKSSEVGGGTWHAPLGGVDKLLHALVAGASKLFPAEPLAQGAGQAAAAVARGSWPSAAEGGPTSAGGAPRGGGDPMGPAHEGKHAGGLRRDRQRRRSSTGTSRRPCTEAGERRVGAAARRAPEDADLISDQGHVEDRGSPELMWNLQARVGNSAKQHPSS
ncbi:unnamed protein product, partial [Prorocentrum cordatum]